MIAAVIAEKNVSDAIRGIKKNYDSDMIELRLDYIENLSLKSIKGMLDSSKRPIIATCRKKGEGGKFNGKEDERLKILEEAIDCGAKYADIELSSNKLALKSILKNRKKTNIIVSYHNFEKTDKKIIKKYEEIKKLNPGSIKIVTKANSVTDNFIILDLLKKAKKERHDISAFCMGDYGQFSRILSLIYGSEIAYASANQNSSAPGQLTSFEMSKIYLAKKLNEKTKIAGLIGNPVEHSFGHIIHNAAFENLGINAVYLKFKVDKLKEFIEYFKDKNVLGFSVTAPHKVEVMKYLDKIDKKAKKIGAVNTIVAKNRKFYGYNTDCDGAMQALEQKTALKGKNVAVLGAGGASRAIIYGLKEKKSNVTIFNRTADNAKKLAGEFGCNYGLLKDAGKYKYDILINTTPVGMSPNVDRTPIKTQEIGRNTVVFDIIFNPMRTKLLKEAETRGCRTISGFEMFIKQAVLQTKLWAGKNAPENLMRQKVFEYGEINEA